jgi:hypothetical protein
MSQVLPDAISRKSKAWSGVYIGDLLGHQPKNESNYLMRIGTWNVEYANPSRNPDRLALLTAKAADIWVLTETHCDLDLSETHGSVCSEQRPILGNRRVNRGSTWVTIWSKFPLIRKISVPDPHRMVAAVFDTPKGPLVVAGVVLPWHDDVGDDPADPRPAQWDEHRRVLRDQLPVLLRSMREESGGSRRVIAGDFNSHQAFPYPLLYPYPHDESLRRALAELLANDSLTCHTANELYPLPLPLGLIPQTLIDHVCTDFGSAERLETWSGIDGKRPRLSDHPGVIVTLPG